MENLKTIDIKGKPYVMVHERIRYFREADEFKGWSYDTDITQQDEDSVTFKCIIKDPEGRVIATGHAQEFRETSPITRTSFVEVAETSAIGRALGGLNIGIQEGFASADEVNTAIKGQADNRPWMNEATYKNALLQLGKMNTLDERKKGHKYLMETYRMKNAYRRELDAMVNEFDLQTTDQ